MNGRLLLIVIALLATLAACGKKSGLDPPDGTTASYTYPKLYPNPASVLPESETPSKTQKRLPPPFAGDLSPLPNDRAPTTTYQSGPSQ
jgi:predicted small lipoprotein YifL